jgi:hypothetical protein
LGGKLMSFQKDFELLVIIKEIKLFCQEKFAIFIEKCA